MNPSEAAEALAALQTSRERLAAAASCPPERHLAFAVIMGSLVACQAAPPLWTIGIEVLLIGAGVLVFLWDRRRTGMFINGYRAGRTRPLTFLLLGVTIIFLTLGIWLKHGLGLTWGPIACGLAVAVFSYGLSAAWQRIYKRELQETP
jgi:hypothetical protein